MYARMPSQPRKQVNGVLNIEGHSCGSLLRVLTTLAWSLNFTLPRESVIKIQDIRSKKWFVFNVGMYSTQ